MKSKWKGCSLPKYSYSLGEIYVKILNVCGVVPNSHSLGEMNTENSNIKSV